MTVISISAHEVDAVAVFVPEGSLIGQSAVGDGDVIVVVVGGKGTSMVVGHGVTCRDNRDRKVKMSVGSQSSGSEFSNIGSLCSAGLVLVSLRETSSGLDSGGQLHLQENRGL